LQTMKDVKVGMKGGWNLNDKFWRFSFVTTMIFKERDHL
jgi:hypothetical protein